MTPSSEAGRRPEPFPVRSATHPVPARRSARVFVDIALAAASAGDREAAVRSPLCSRLAMVPWRFV